MLRVCFSSENVHQVDDFQLMFSICHLATPTFCIIWQLSYKTVQLSACLCNKRNPLCILQLFTVKNTCLLYLFNMVILGS